MHLFPSGEVNRGPQLRLVIAPRAAVAAAYDLQMVVSLLVYACAIGERSSRAIERRLREIVAFRVIAANQIPDRATRHPHAEAEVPCG